METDFVLWTRMGEIPFFIGEDVRLDYVYFLPWFFENRRHVYLLERFFVDFTPIRRCHFLLSLLPFQEILGGTELLGLDDVLV